MGQVIIIVLIGRFADDTRLSMALRAGMIEAGPLSRSPQHNPVGPG